MKVKPTMMLTLKLKLKQVDYRELAKVSACGALRKDNINFELVNVMSKIEVELS